MKQIGVAIDALRKAITDERACTSACKYYRDQKGYEYLCSKCVRNATDHFEAKDASATWVQDIAKSALEETND